MTEIPPGHLNEVGLHSRGPLFAEIQDVSVLQAFQDHVLIQHDPGKNTKFPTDFPIRKFYKKLVHKFPIQEMWRNPTGYLSEMYFQCRDGPGSKWLPVLKVWEQLCQNHSKVGQNTHRQKACAILLLKNASRILLAHTADEKNEHENFDFVLSSASFFFPFDRT